MSRDVGHREAKQVGRKASPYIAIKLVAQGGCSSTRGSLDCGLLVPLSNEEVTAEMRGHSLYSFPTL